jgi:flagellar motor switch protein FliM
MTGVSANHLSQAKVSQLLAAVGSAHAQDEPAVQAVEYNWRDPHSFNEDQLNQLAAVMSQVAARIAETFARFYSSEFHVSPTSITQHFADDLHNHVDLDHGYCLTFAPDKGQPCGFVTMAAEAALTWVTRLLGDSESDGEPQRALSSLEESLLSDLMAAVLDGFLMSLRPHHNLKPGPQPCLGQPGIQFDLIEEICRIVFQVTRADAEEASDITFLLPCDRLATLVGKTATPVSRPSPQELAQTLMDHLQQMPVTLTVKLASTAARFREILELSAGDILLLNKSVDESVELILDGRTAFRGRPARSQNQYAIVIAESLPGRATASQAPVEARKG